MSAVDRDFRPDERADAEMVVRLLGTLAVRWIEKEGEPNVQLLRACGAVAADLEVHDDLSGYCLALLILQLTGQDDSEALDYSRREVALCRRLPKPGPLAEALGRQSRVLESMREPEQALAALAEARDAAMEDGNIDLAVTIALDQARIQGVHLESFDEAVQSLQQAHNLSAKASESDTRERVRTQIEAALTWILSAAAEAEDAGEHEVATHHLLLVERTADAQGMASHVARARSQRARLLAATLGRPDEALPLAESARALARQCQMEDLLTYTEQLIRAIQRDLQGQ